MLAKYKTGLSKLKKKLGLTLIEMLTVIAVIAILISIIIPIIGKSVTKSAAATNAANLRAIEGKISVLRVESPQIFDDTLTKEGMSYDQFLTYLDNANFSLLTKIVLTGYFLDGGNEYINNYLEYHIYHSTADANGVITISVSPSVQVTGVPTSEKVEAGDMQLPEGLPMTVYVSETKVLATYEYNGNSYTKDDFALVAETGDFTGTGSGGLTNDGVLGDLEQEGNCWDGNHVFEEDSCVCTFCGVTDHAGYTSLNGQEHACTRCNQTFSHDFYASSSCNDCGYTCPHNWTITDSSHSCGNCGTSGGHDYGLLGNECEICGWVNEEDDGDCITPDTLITLADGSEKRVDELTGDEMLLVWNHLTGELDEAPIAYLIDHNGESNVEEVIHLFFSNGSEVKIIGEHIFFDATLNRYVPIQSDAEEYIGHTFLALNEDGTGLEEVTLTAVEFETVETEIYEVVSYKHMTAFTENMLSACAYIDGMLNAFEFDAETRAYDAESMQKDIEQYGLLSYSVLKPFVSEEVFEMHNAEYLSIAFGKKTMEKADLMDLISMYNKYVK